MKALVIFSSLLFMSSALAQPNVPLNLDFPENEVKIACVSVNSILEIEYRYDIKSAVATKIVKNKDTGETLVGYVSSRDAAFSFNVESGITTVFVTAKELDIYMTRTSVQNPFEASMPYRCHDIDDSYRSECQADWACKIIGWQ
jgi:hypothetical protein